MKRWNKPDAIGQRSRGMNEDDPQAMARMNAPHDGYDRHEHGRRYGRGHSPHGSRRGSRQSRRRDGDVLDAEDPFGATPSGSSEGRLKAMKRRLTEAPNVDPKFTICELLSFNLFVI